MEFTALHLIWLLSAFTLTKQESERLKVSPTVAAECDRKVFLQCNTSSAQPELSVKHMAWSQGSRILCSMKEGEKITSHKNDSLSDFHCEYEDGRLTLVFDSVLPLESGETNPYLCKLHSNKGTAHAYTTVELQECSGKVQSVLTSDGPNCTFHHVYPDGDVDWSQGSQNLSVKPSIAKSVDEHGWLTIQSWLTISDQRRGSHEPYNCSLKNPTSGRYITSALVLKPESQSRKRNTKLEKESNSNRIGSEKTMTTVLSILVLLIFTWE